MTSKPLTPGVLAVALVMMAGGPATATSWAPALPVQYAQQPSSKVETVSIGGSMVQVSAPAPRLENFIITVSPPREVIPSTLVQDSALALGVESFDTRLNSVTPSNGGCSPAITSNFADNARVGVKANPTPNNPIVGTYPSNTTSTHPGNNPNCVRIHNADVFGGAGTGSGTGGGPNQQRYLSVNSGTRNQLTLTLSVTPAGSADGVEGVNYFGLWISALDAGNSLTFLENGREVGVFNPPDLIRLISDFGGACNNTTLVNPYCGNPFRPTLPGNGQGNRGEPYAYVNFVDTGGFFNQVRWTQTTPGANYESDNHAVGFCPKPLECVSGTVVPTWEPGTWSLFGLGLAAIGLARRRRNRLADPR